VFLILMLDGRKWSAPRLGRFTSGKMALDIQFIGE